MIRAPLLPPTPASRAALRAARPAPVPEPPSRSSLRDARQPARTGGRSRASAVPPRRRPGRLVAAVAALLAVLLVAGWVGRDLWVSRDVATAGSFAGCDATVGVRLAVAPELANALGVVLADPVRFGTSCAVVGIESVAPLQVAGSLEALDAAAAPQIWIPDSSSWLARTTTTIPFEDVGSLVTSPVVLSTGVAALAQLGWAAAPPTWAQALTSGRDLAVQDLASTAEGVLTLTAMRTSLGTDPSADAAVAQVALAAGRGEVASPAQALQAAATDDPAAPLVAVSEQQVLSSTAVDGLRAVYPADGSPWLDYPVVRVGDDVASAAATQAVLGALRSPRTASALAEAGFRLPDGTVSVVGGLTAPDGTAAPATVPALTVDPAAVTALLDRLVTLAVPSRLLTVVGLPTSMQSSADDGRTRVALAADALRSALAVLPDSAVGGLWLFSAGRTESSDVEDVSPVAAMTADDGGETHRQRLDELFAGLPDQVSGDSAALYDTVLAAVRAQRAGYDPAAVNTVAVLTDSSDEGSDVDLDELVATLTAERDPTRPVQVVAISIGPDADDDALAQIAAATGGAAYTADDPGDLQNVLFDALGRRT